MYTIYRVTGTATKQSYYGYATGSLQDAQKTFLVGANRPSDERIDVQFAEKAGALSFEAIGECEDEALALVMRNEARASCAASVSGPTNWPAMLHRIAQTQYGERADRPVQLYKAMRKATAREAYADAAFTFSDLKNAMSATNTDRETITADLNSMSPREFVEKYNIRVTHAM